MNDSAAEYAEAAGAYFKHHRLFRCRMKRVTDMSDDEVAQKCHWWKEGNNMVKDYWQFVREKYPRLG